MASCQQPVRFAVSWHRLMNTAHANGVEIAYSAAGEGETVLLVGGSGMDQGVWDFSFKPALVQAGYRVVTYDSRGGGGSSAPEPPYSIEDLALDAVGLVEQVSDGPCHVVGLSLGGFVAEEICWRRPDLVRSVVLVASGGRTTAYMRAKMQAEERLFAAGPVPVDYDLVDALSVFLPAKVLQDDDKTVEQWAQLIGATDGPGRIGQGAAARAWLLDDGRVERWPNMRVPALFVAFEHDIQFPPSRVKEAAEEWPQASFVEIPGVAHGNGVFDAASQIGEAIVGFLPLMR
ncbi:alpha/beta fold hydrolase [Nonomuraea helvata]|uniref:Alpha/beta fold hydrolase n=2 Tax=Nonomuraea helvata TaxID=37484 RepID=A0ABV5SGH5_9ACTN